MGTIWVEVEPKQWGKVIKEPALHSVGSLKNLQSIKTYISSENYVLISMFKCSTQILYLQIFFAFIFRNRRKSRYWHCGGRWGVLHLGHLFILNLKNYYETHDY